ncbi:MAG: sensor histidine kinase [Candidatus Binatia bacterium]
MDKSGDQTNRAAHKGAAVPAVIVVALLAAMGRAMPIAGMVAPASLAISIMALAPIFFAWGPGVQSLVAAAGIASYVWCVPTGALWPERFPYLLIALVTGATFSVFGALQLERQREAERLERQRVADRTQKALAGLEIRTGMASLTGQSPEGRAGGPQSDGPDDPVESIERIAVGLGRVRVHERKELLRERDMNAHFIGQAAHEFRTPLAVIQTAAETLKLYSGRMTSHAQQQRLIKIEDSVQHMTDLLRNALTFSRADAGKLKCDRQPVDLRALAQQVVNDIKANFGEREIALTIRGAARLPQLDPSLVREIMSNLLTNAVKYSPNGGPIEVDVFTGAAEVKFRVTDHGIGLRQEDQAHIFDAFRRGENVGDIPGTGLGLAITKRAAEVHGGTITVESRLGSGTTFTVSLQERVEPGQSLPSKRSA